ncbi:hypothetical protein KKC65_00295 [Patescibacteria group bacterium]|nr:hypothetical protein [Patescibacteria group bacterium]
MTKKYFIITLALLLSPILVEAMNVSDITINEAPSAYFYKQEFDKLVLDITIPGSDSLSAITIKNEGNAVDRYDIDKFVLWKDAGQNGFQGMGKDEEIGDFEYDANNRIWYVKDLDVVIPEQGLRIFVSVEVARGMTNGRYVQIKIPELDDVDNDGNFDIGDFGIFLESRNNGPVDGSIINSASQTLKSSSTRDNSSPVSIIDSTGDVTTESYTITGQSRDQGGSSPAWVKVEINNVLYDVEDTGTNYSTWKYEWENITEGTYTIKTQSADWLNNIETEGDSITVIVDFPDEEETPIDKPPVEEPPVEEPELTPEEQIRAQIKEIQEQIIDLLNQLIQIYLQELDSI